MPNNDKEEHVNFITAEGEKHENICRANNYIYRK